MIAIVLVAALLAGLLLGLLGGGGSIVLIPVLVVALGSGVREAGALSLLVVAVAGSLSVARHARAGRVGRAELQVVAAMALTGALGAYVGARVSAAIADWVLLALLVTLLVASGVSMGRDQAAPRDSRAPGPGAVQAAGGTRTRGAVAVLALAGLIVGVLSGLVGAGGGFVVVPVLLYFRALELRAAIVAATMITTAQALAGTAGHLALGALDLRLSAMVVAAALVGTFAGTTVLERIDTSSLRRAVRAVVFGLAALLVAREGLAHTSLDAPSGLLLATLLAASTVCATLCVGRRVAQADRSVDGSGRERVPTRSRAHLPAPTPSSAPVTPVA